MSSSSGRGAFGSKFGQLEHVDLGAADGALEGRIGRLRRESRVIRLDILAVVEERLGKAAFGAIFFISVIRA